MMMIDERKDTELDDREPTIEDVRRGIRGSAFEYITLADAEVLHTIDCCDGWALVIGHPNWGSYEWVYVECYVPQKQGDEKWQHSNSGWGSVASALREALIHADGGHCCECGCCVLPEDVEIRCHRCREVKQ